MLTVILDMNFRPEMVEAFLETAREGLKETRVYSGCREVTVLRDQNEPTRITFYERWDSREHYQKYLDWREEQGATEGMRQISAEPPKWRFYDSVGDV